MIPILELTSTSDMGGAERMVLWLAQGLDKSQFRPHVGSLIGSGGLMERCAATGIDSVHFHFRNPVDPAGIYRLVRYIRRNKIQIIQTHGLRADSIGRWAARLGGAKAVVSTIHSIDPWRNRVHVAIDRATDGFVSQYVAVCEAAKLAAVQREKIDPNRITVVPIGIPERMIPRANQKEIRDAFGIPSDAWPVIGILANLREMKGHRHALAALPEILSSFPKAIFLFAGRDDSHGEIVALAKKAHLSEHVRMPGFVADSARVLAAIDIFLLPSDWEGFPVSIIEAMHAQVPVIATNVGGIPEMIRNGQDGLLILPKSPAAIAESVQMLAHDWAARGNMVRNSNLRAQSEFCQIRMVNRMEQIFFDIMKIT